jgi:hypothetical protein
MTLLQLAHPGSIPQPSASQMFQSSAGQVRIDTPETSVITNPLTMQMIVLVHATLEAHVLPLPAAAIPGVAPPALGLPSIPGLALPQVQPSSVIDLGVAVIAGIAVTGKQFAFAPPAIPGAPPVPQAPSIPGLPQAPALPGVPQPPPPPQTVVEAWISTATLLPVLTTVIGPFGTQICQCNTAPSVEPSPSMFQIPPGYSPAGSSLPQVSAPQAPPVSGVPQMPSVPGMPAAPPIPSLPQSSSLPQAPSAPSMPSAPSAPQVPSVPKIPGFPQ